MRSLDLSRLARFVLGGLVLAAVFACVGALFRAVVFIHGVRAAEVASAVWGGLLLASFVGWGGALNGILFPQARADLGLRCAWGWGVAVAAGGLLCALGAGNRRALVGFTAAGLLLLAVQLVWAGVQWTRGPWVRPRRLRVIAADAPFLLGAAAIFALAALHAYVAVYSHAFNENDDNLAYFQFAREILDRGTLTQPFSLRRISAYSGKSVLDAITLAIDVPETHLHLLDKGLATLTILALLFGGPRGSRRGARVLHLLAMLFVVSLPDTGINTSSMRTAVVFFLGLYRTLTWAPVAEGRGVRSAVPVALLAAGACTLRQNYLPAVAALLIVAYSQPILRGLRFHPFSLGQTPKPLRRWFRVDLGALRDAGVTAALLVAFLLPWWVMAWRWCGTFLFPVRHGFYDPSYSFFPRVAVAERIRYFWVNASFNLPVKATPLFLLAALTMRDRVPRRPLAAVVIAAFVGFAALLYGYPAADPPNQARYYFGFTFAAILVIALGAADLASRSLLSERRHGGRLIGVLLVTLGMTVQIYDERDRVSNEYRDAMIQVTASLPRWAPQKPDPVYEALQKSIPEGAPIAVMVDNPSRFDHRRNRVECLDMVGAVSPPPGIPLAAGGEAVARYLVGLGYRYVVLVGPENAVNLYRRDVWQKQQQGSDPVWRRSAHFYLEAFDAFDTLRATRAHLAEAGGMMTLDLATGAP